MITNKRHYDATKASARLFEEALEHADEQGVDWDPVLHAAMRRGNASELAMLRAQLQEYDDFRTGKVRTLTIDKLDDLPDVLIRARIASGLTQRALAEEMGLKEQQIQRYEATRYKSASFTRLVEVALVLKIEVHLQANLPDPVAFRAWLRESDAQVAAMMQRLHDVPAEAQPPPARRDHVA